MSQFNISALITSSVLITSDETASYAPAQAIIERFYEATNSLPVEGDVIVDEHIGFWVVKRRILGRNTPLSVVFHLEVMEKGEVFGKR